MSQFDSAMASSGMKRIYERYKASPNYVSNELLDYLCDEKEFCNFCHLCGPEKTYFYTNSSLKFHFRLRHAQEILKIFPQSKIENARYVNNEDGNEYDFDSNQDVENDDDSITLSLSESEDEVEVIKVIQKEAIQEKPEPDKNESKENVVDLSDDDEEDNQPWFDDSFRLYLSESEDEEMEPTKEMKQSEGEESEQISYSMNFDPTQFVFEHELKIIKVETLDSDVGMFESAIKSEVIENDIKQENIEEETHFEFHGTDGDLDIDDKGPLQTALQNEMF